MVVVAGEVVEAQREVGTENPSGERPGRVFTDGGTVCCLVGQRQLSQLCCWNVAVTQEQEDVSLVHE